MSHIGSQRVWSVAAAAMLALTMSAASAQGGKHALDGLIEAVLRRGPDSQLPAHLSVVLGVSAGERPTPVKQAVLRNGSTVKTFNVCLADHDEVVFVTYDEQIRASKAYRVSPSGTLRKAVAFQAGAPAVERTQKEAASDFAGELKFWTDFEHRPTVAK